MSNENKDQIAKLLELVRSVVQHDDKLREQFQVGTKFKFIHDRLEALLRQINEHAEQMQEKGDEKIARDEVQQDEMVVWVYLFNLQGLTLQTWQKMLLPSVFYEYSVNRPIYTEQAHVETLIRQKSNRVQHGYLKVVVKKADLLSESTLDACGNPIIKVKEGALHFDRLVAFYHNKNEYHVGERGQLEKVAY